MRKVLPACLLLLLGAMAWGAFPQPAVQPAVSFELSPFPNSQVTLLPGTPWYAAREQAAKYLLWLDPDRLLDKYRRTAGLPSEAPSYGGWEASPLAGHFLGHYLSALALMYAGTHQEVFKQRAAYVVKALAACQQALGTGYMGAFDTSYFDRLEKGEHLIIYYSVHKLLAGLLDAYLECGDSRALQVAEGLADYFCRRTRDLPPGVWDKMLRSEFGGMNDVLYQLYALTGRRRYFELAHKFDEPAFLGPLALHHDNLTGLHANTHIPIVIGAARRYELTGERTYRDLCEFFWHRVVDYRTYATGGTSFHEHWGEPGRLADTLRVENQECCTSYNMLKLTRHLLRWSAEARFGDYYERVMVNSRLGTIHPTRLGWLCYFVPLGAGFDKAFGGPWRDRPSPDKAFWCCYGTGLEEFAKLQDSIYFRLPEGGVYVNEFIASKVEVPELGLVLEQVSDFPYEFTTRLKLQLARPRTFTLALRRPGWLAADMQVKLNGKPFPCTQSGLPQLLRLHRTWQPGDTLDLTLPPSLHASALPDDHHLQAFMYGPVVLAAVNCRNSQLVTTTEKVASQLVPIPGKRLHFSLATERRKLEFAPLFELFETPYTVYFDVIVKGSGAWRSFCRRQEAKRALARRTVDFVLPNVKASETAHHLRSIKSRAGGFYDHGWRDALPGGFFSWELKALPDVPLTLYCTYYGGDVGRKFVIEVDGRRIAEESIEAPSPGELFSKSYPLPLALTRGKHRLRVTFRAVGDHIAGGVFYCALLKPLDEGKK